MIYPITNSQYEDEFNLSNKRNVRNTPRRTYNCGGFALGCFSWYCPREDFFQYAFNDYAEALVKTLYSMKCMLADFADLRVISSLDEVEENEYPILFRHSSDGDFHYVKRGQNGVWYHKRGASTEIEVMRKEKIFDKWCNRYDGPIIMFAKKFSTK